MQPLNPFLQAFFRSTLPAQCIPVSQHILLVPSTDFLLHHKDTETQLGYGELVKSEEFLASHVIRVLGNTPIPITSKESTSIRESKNKARQYATFNGRGVVVKESFVYSNKGFKNLTQAQLLNDTLYYPDALDAQQWLVYYISKALIGSPEPWNALRSIRDGVSPISDARSRKAAAEESSVAPLRVATFNEVLRLTPHFAQYFLPNLDLLYKDFYKTLETATHTTEPHTNHDGLESETIQNLLIEAHEMLVTSALELWQKLEIPTAPKLKTQIIHEYPEIDRLIERYVTEQVHDTVFPKLCGSREVEDTELEYHLKQMVDIDVSQVGVDIRDDNDERRELSIRLTQAVATFKKMAVASSPQEMVEVVLETERCVASRSGATGLDTSSNPGQDPEKVASVLNANADTLVAELLIVLIRSPVRNLLTRLLYMQRFNFVDNVESGEIGYALSTFEAVVTYLSNDAGDLKRASRANHALWQAVKKGNLAAIQTILTPNDAPDGAELNGTEFNLDLDVLNVPKRDSDSGSPYLNGNMTGSLNHERSASQPLSNEVLPNSNLSHVFPFANSPPIKSAQRPQPIKRVSMGRNSFSSSSGRSFSSHASTIMSCDIVVASDTSAEHLAHTCNALGHSILRMAIERSQKECLTFLLGLEEFFSIQFVLRDRNNDGTTLLSAAIQSENVEIVNILLKFIKSATTDSEFSDYLRAADNKGRSSAHYLFHVPHLLSTIGHLVDWKQRDINGQTPLFALCRSYDHERYRWMVETGLTVARDCQKDEEPLHLDDHVDKKGNTLLHIVNDPKIVQWLLYYCDSDPNAVNEKHFTPLMVASKFARIDSVRILFGDARVDLHARDLRGLTAVELAKDDEVRNRIDDMTLLSSIPALKERMTSVVRSFFVEDGSIRLVLKSAAPNLDSSSITVTTCRRSAVDFENLARWLTMEHPASWVPSIYNLRMPFQLPSRPSRALLRDIQIRLDNFLQTMLHHTTFSTHEMLWEFFLVPDISQAGLAERTKRKAELRVEKLKEEYDPVEDPSEVEIFVGHAREQVRSVHYSSKVVLRRVNALRNTANNLAEIQSIAAKTLSLLSFVPPAHQKAFNRHATVLQLGEYHPLTALHYALAFSISCTTALLHSLNRPTTIIANMATHSKNLTRLSQASTRTNIWPSALGLLEDTRARLQQGSQDKINKAESELKQLGCELRYTQQTVAAELAGWQEGRARALRASLREWVGRTVVLERERLAGMRRVLREIGKNEGSRE